MSRADVRKAIKAGDALVRTFQSMPGRQRREGVASPRPRTYDRDRQRSRVYTAEHQFGQLVRERGQFPRVNLAGVSLDIPDQLAFGALPQVQEFVDQVAAHTGCSHITVRTSDRLTRAAHYCGGVITLPLGGDPRWAWRQSTVLHEVAHHLAGGGGHNSPFPGLLVDLFTDWISPEAGLLLRLLYQSNDVTI